MTASLSNLSEAEGAAVADFLAEPDVRQTVVQVFRTRLADQSRGIGPLEEAFERCGQRTDLRRSMRSIRTTCFARCLMGATAMTSTRAR